MIRQQLELWASDRQAILNRCVHRLEYERKEEESRKTEADMEDADRIAFQSIDWHDFVVVETIEFAENEELPAPGGGGASGAIEATDDVSGLSGSVAGGVDLTSRCLCCAG